MKALKVVLGLLAVAIVGVLSLAVAQPDTFRIERSTVIQAPPEAIAAAIADFRTWPRWSPFEARNITDMILEPQPAGGTKLTWAMHGPQPLLNKVMCVIFDMDKMVGRPSKRASPV